MGLRDVKVLESIKAFDVEYLLEKCLEFKDVSAQLAYLCQNVIYMRDLKNMYGFFQWCEENGCLEIVEDVDPITGEEIRGRTVSDDPIDRNNYEADRQYVNYSYLALVQQIKPHIETRKWILQLPDREQVSDKKDDNNSEGFTSEGIEPIQWMGKDTQLIYLLSELVDKGLLSSSLIQNLPSFIESHFINAKGMPIKNVSQKVYNMLGKKPRYHELIDDVLSEIEDK